MSPCKNDDWQLIFYIIIENCFAAYHHCALVKAGLLANFMLSKMFYLSFIFFFLQVWQ